MRAFFHRKKTKSSVMTILVSTLIIACAMPAMAFAEDFNKPDWNDYKNDAQTAIDPAFTNHVTDAQQKADAAQEAADAAKKAADDAMAEAMKAENTADAAKTTGDQADSNADLAENTHTDGSKYTAETKTQIESAVDNAVKTIEAKAGEAKDAAEDAQAAAQKAVDAEAKAKDAKTPAEAEAAAKEASDAAKVAETKAAEANIAYLAADSTLNAARDAYDKAVAAANIEINQYNSQMQSYIDTVNHFDLALLKKSYEDAAANAKAAELAAAGAATDADAAKAAAEAAADKAINYYVNPAKLAYDSAMKEKADADAAKLAAEKLATEKQAIESQKRDQYEAIVASTTATARAAQDADVAQKKEAAEAAKAAYDKLNSWEKGLQQLLNTGQYKQWKEAEKAFDHARSETTYHYIINSALQSTPEYLAFLSAKGVAANAQSEAAAKALAAANAQNALLEKETQLNNAKKTRDDYLAEIKAAVGNDTEVAKILAAMENDVDNSETDVNKTVYDGDLYDWAGVIKDETWWKIWHWDVYDDARTTVGVINQTYTKAGFIEWLDETFPWIHNVKNTDEIIAMAEAAYRQELKLQEEELASNQAYLAKLKAAKAAEDAAAKKAAAAEATAKLTAASEKLAAAEKVLAEAKAQVAKLEKMKLDTQNALVKLNHAQALVDEAKQTKNNAQQAENDAKENYKNANRELDQFTIGMYRVQYLVTGSTIETKIRVADDVTGNSTASALNITPPSLYADYKNYRPVRIENGAFGQLEGSVTIQYDDPGFHEHMVTVWYDKAPVEPANPNPIYHGGNKNNTIVVTDEAVPASPISGDAIGVTESAINVPAEEIVFDDKVPAGALPKTGGVAPLFLYGFGLLLAGSGVALKRKDNKNGKA